MKIKHITIQLEPSYSDNAGKYTAKIEYEEKSGAIQLVLDTKISEALMLCIGQTITEFAYRASKQLEADIALSVAEARNVPVIEATT